MMPFYIQMFHLFTQEVYNKWHFQTNCHLNLFDGHDSNVMLVTIQQA
jgi:hypothetical protein